jgi:hypothetical protein
VWHGKAATGHMVPAGARQDKRDADWQVRRSRLWFDASWFMCVSRASGIEIHNAERWSVKAHH